MNLSKGKYIRESVFGAEDGLVSTLGFVVGLTAAGATSKIIVIGGIAEVVAAAISMAAGSYLSIKSQKEFYQAKEKRSKHLHLENPLKGGFVMFLSFILGALVPLFPYFFGKPLEMIYISAILTVISLFIFGAFKGKITKRNWLKSGLEMSLIGFVASLVGFLIGIGAKALLGI